MGKIRNEKDFLSEAEKINVMGGMSGSYSLQEDVFLYILRGCGWADCKRVCGPGEIRP